AELTAIPLTLIVLAFVFRGVIAASHPLLVGVIAIMGTLYTLFVLGSLTDVSIYSIKPDHRARSGSGHRLFLVHRVPVPRGTAPRPLRSRRRRAIRGNGGPDDRHRRPDRRRLAVGPVDLPAPLPAIVRLRRHRGCPPRHAVVARHPSGPSRRRRPSSRHAPSPSPGRGGDRRQTRALREKCRGAKVSRASRAPTASTRPAPRWARTRRPPLATHPTARRGSRSCPVSSSSPVLASTSSPTSAPSTRASTRSSAAARPSSSIPKPSS